MRPDVVVAPEIKALIEWHERRAELGELGVDAQAQHSATARTLAAVWDELETMQWIVGDVRALSKVAIDGDLGPDYPGDHRANQGKAEQARETLEFIDRYNAALRLAPVAPMRNRVVRAPDALWSAAQQVAATRGVTVSAVIRDKLGEYVNDREETESRS